MSESSPSRYAHLIELIELWDEFEKTTRSGDRLEFARWMLVRESGPGSNIHLQDSVKKELTQESEPDWVELIPVLDDQLTFLLGRLAQFLRHYVRDAFHDLPISSIDDFSVLAGIGLLQNPTKSEVYQVAACSVTTGAETLRRFIALELVEETVDAKDRRVRRVSLTVKGENVAAAATTRMSLVAQVATADLSIDEKETLRGILSKLHTFHERQFKVGETLSAKNVLANQPPRSKN